MDQYSASGYSNVGFAYAGLNRLGEAKATFNQAIQRKIGLAASHASLANIAWLQGDKNAMERELDLMKNDPQGDFIVNGFRSAVAAGSGQLKIARRFGPNQREAAGRFGFQEAVATEFSPEAF